MQVCLFDIDGTLLNTGGAGQTAMLAAVADEFGVSEPLHDIPAAGRTDRAIAFDVFRAFGLDFSEAAFGRFHQRYLELLPEHLRISRGQTLPGIPPLLEWIRSQDHLARGLLTGNFQGSAWLKLQHYALHDFFDFGGFGDRHVDRNDVAREAFELIRSRFGSDFSPDDVWVIGDTPSDIHCARAIGANAVAVATGIYTADALQAEAPDFLFDDLADFQRFAKLLSM